MRIPQCPSSRVGVVEAFLFVKQEDIGANPRLGIPSLEITLLVT